MEINNTRLRVSSFEGLENDEPINLPMKLLKNTSLIITGTF